MVYNIISGVFLAIRAAIFLFSTWALVSMLRRDAMDFSATVRGRGFWLAVLIGCAAVSLIGLLRGGVPGLLEWLVLYGLVYYMGPEEQRMGPPREQWGHHA
ncbi:DUF2516 family protein [Neoactinobaculum massilliense]|uniref:DUF2516 family protein n=1 Tax=Neoactinobaculum massilliense TaxID=2364794 RepID=UPI0013DE45F2|nr:DUF2516 family protein [Neoactinobaculum massilliense]